MSGKKWKTPSGFLLSAAFLVILTCVWLTSGVRHAITEPIHSVLATPKVASSQADRSDTRRVALGINDIRRVENQQAAMTVLFQLAGNRYSRREEVSLILTPAEEGKIHAAIDTVERHAQDREDCMGLLFVFARTCNDYSFIGSGSVGTNQQYVGVFDFAFWNCCVRLSLMPGMHPHDFLLALKKELSDVHSRDYIDELLKKQSAVSTHSATH